MLHPLKTARGEKNTGSLHPDIHFCSLPECYESREFFDAYMRFGGMLSIADIGLDQEKALMLLEGIYSTVIVRDILEREKLRSQKRITDSVLLKKLLGDV